MPASLGGSIENGVRRYTDVMVRSGDSGHWEIDVIPKRIPRMKEGR